MDIKYEFRNLTQVQSLANRAPDVFLRNMMVAAKVATRDITRDARAKHRFRSRSGHLEGDVENLVQVDSQNGVLGIVRLDPNGPSASYGAFVHEGTRPHIIAPRNKKWLRWPVSDGFRFAKKVMHPGTKPDQFIYNAGEANQAHINDVFNRYVDRAAKEIDR